MGTKFLIAVIEAVIVAREPESPAMKSMVTVNPICTGPNEESASYARTSYERIARNPARRKILHGDHLSVKIPAKSPE